jgi:hypothetical protein
MNRDERLRILGAEAIKDIAERVKQAPSPLSQEQRDIIRAAFHTVVGGAK